MAVGMFALMQHHKKTAASSKWPVTILALLVHTPQDANTLLSRKAIATANVPPFGRTSSGLPDLLPRKNTQAFFHHR